LQIDHAEKWISVSLRRRGREAKRDVKGDKTEEKRGGRELLVRTKTTQENNV